MSRRRIAVLAAACWIAGLAVSAGARAGTFSAEDLVQSVLTANQSAGFDAHAQLTKVDDGRVETWRLYIAGRNQGDERQLLVRALLPRAWAGASIVAGAYRAGPIHIKAVDTAETRSAPGDYEPLFGSSLTLWDLLGLWWYWPKQAQVGSDTLLDRPCVIVDSSGGNDRIALVRSWISPELRTPLRLDLFDRQGKRLQRLDITRVVRRKDGSGVMRSMNIIDADGSSTLMEIYNGSDHADVPRELAGTTADRDQGMSSP
jgi:hypothetical protein